MDRLSTVAEAVELLGTTDRFPRRLIAERRIRFVKLGSHFGSEHVKELVEGASLSLGESGDALVGSGRGKDFDGHGLT